MGKHSRRKSGYLPKVAAGAAPVALLFAAPATAFATPSDLTLPLDRIELPVDHRHSGALTDDGTTLSATRHDVVTKQLGDVRLAADLAEAVAAGGDRLGAGDRARHGVFLGNGVDVLSENAEQVDTGLRGVFSGDLTGALSARRSSGQAVDLGMLGAVGTASEQHLTGQLSGVLDLGQQHELGGQLGPAWGLVKTSQSVGPAASGSISGDLGVDHVTEVQGGSTTTVRGTLRQHESLTASVLDQPVLDL
ncbi:hypothetical protein ACIA5G_08090 [Amycolatopsis sp. NPDC051758]|uniref:hypothetical protein n=1 Tax=Amycolatopsis sp. NPDC051758 TaxID=3363935 RepID=UPI0037A0402A